MTRRFLEAAGWGAATAAPLAGDASGRRYTRLTRGDGSAVLMQARVASADDRASFDAFRTVGAHLLRHGLSAPREVAADPAAGLILMEDLGDTTLSHLLATDLDRAERAYAAAAALLPRLAALPPPPGVATPDPLGMVDLTLDQTPDPAAHKTLKQTLSSALAEHAPGAPSLSLRDVHGDNLLWLPNRDGDARVGLLDYQDAMMLPAGYDLASLVDDPRRVVPEAWRNALIATSGHTPERIDTLSLLRNLRIMGIFHRLATLMSKPVYRAFLPRTRALIRASARRLPGMTEPVETLLDATRDWPGGPPPCLILAAGLGTRMRPMTDHTPKGLLRVAGKTLLDHSLHVAREAACPVIAVNAHHHADQMVGHLRGQNVKVLVEQPNILDSGGALKNAMRHLPVGPVATLNADAVWTGPNALSQLWHAFDPQRMEALLLLVPYDRAIGRQGVGDFTRDDAGRLTLAKQPGTLVYTGAQILDPRAAMDDPRDIFTLRDIWLDAASRGRLFGVIHPGHWADVGYPGGIALAEAMVSAHV